MWSTIVDCIAICSVEQMFVNVWHSWGWPTEWEEAPRQQHRKFLQNRDISTTLSLIIFYSSRYLVPNSRTIESQKLGPMHVPEHPKSGKHPSQPPVHNVWVFAARLTANLLMVPSILGDQTAQHGHYKSGGDGVEGEAEISARWQEKVGLKQGEVNLILTTLGESRLIPQWQSWVRSTEGQSWRTERQN